MKNFVASGEVLTVPAPSAVASGQPVLVGSIFGVALRAAASGEPVEIAMRGLATLPKATAEALDGGAGDLLERHRRYDIGRVECLHRMRDGCGRIGRHGGAKVFGVPRPANVVDWAFIADGPQFGALGFFVGVKSLNRDSPDPRKPCLIAMLSKPRHGIDRNSDVEEHTADSPVAVEIARTGHRRGVKKCALVH